MDRGGHCHSARTADLHFLVFEIAIRNIGDAPEQYPLMAISRPPWSRLATAASDPKRTTLSNKILTFLLQSGTRFCESLASYGLQIASPVLCGADPGGTTAKGPNYAELEVAESAQVQDHRHPENTANSRRRAPALALQPLVKFRQHRRHGSLPDKLVASMSDGNHNSQRRPTFLLPFLLSKLNNNLSIRIRQRQLSLVVCRLAYPVANWFAEEPRLHRDRQAEQNHW